MTVMDVQWRLTGVVEVFLGKSNSEWRADVEETLPGVAGIEDRS
jgi:hypothetical protein